MKITVEMVQGWKPCCPPYTEERLRELLGDGLTPLEVCDLEAVPGVDRLWVLLRPEVFSTEECLRLGCAFVERVLPIFEATHPGDARPREAIEVTRRFARGEATAEELSAVRDTAWDAAWVAGTAGAVRAFAWSAGAARNVRAVAWSAGIAWDSALAAGTAAGETEARAQLTLVRAALDKAE